MPGSRFKASGGDPVPALPIEREEGLREGGPRLHFPGTRRKGPIPAAVLSPAVESQRSQRSLLNFELMEIEGRSKGTAVAVFPRPGQKLVARANSGELRRPAWIDLFDHDSFRRLIRRGAGGRGR